MFPMSKGMSGPKGKVPVKKKAGGPMMQEEESSFPLQRARQMKKGKKKGTKKPPAKPNFPMGY